MSQIKIRAYYKYDGPSSSNPLQSELPHEDVVRNLKLLKNDLSHSLDENATIEVTDKNYDEEWVKIMIQSDFSLEELKSVIEKVLSDAQLYGNFI